MSTSQPGKHLAKSDNRRREDELRRDLRIARDKRHGHHAAKRPSKHQRLVETQRLAKASDIVGPLVQSPSGLRGAGTSTPTMVQSNDLIRFREPIEKKGSRSCNRSQDRHAGPRARAVYDLGAGRHQLRPDNVEEHFGTVESDLHCSLPFSCNDQDTPSNVPGADARKAVRNLICGACQGQQSKPRKKAGHKTASEQVHIVPFEPCYVGAIHTGHSLSAQQLGSLGSKPPTDAAQHLDGRASSWQLGRTNAEVRPSLSMLRCGPPKPPFAAAASTEGAQRSLVRQSAISLRLRQRLF